MLVCQKERAMSKENPTKAEHKAISSSPSIDNPSSRPLRQQLVDESTSGIGHFSPMNRQIDDQLAAVVD
jgi:hypothetical protein